MAATASANLGAPSATPTPLSTQPVRVRLTYVLPTTPASNGALAQSLRRRSLSVGTTTGPSACSSVTCQLSVTITPINGAPSSAGPSNCSTTSCSVDITATPGLNKFAFTLIDSSNSNVLASFTTSRPVLANNSNNFAFTSNPVAHSAALIWNSNSTNSITDNAGTPINEGLTLNVMDADGNTIVGNANYVDSAGHPVAFLLNVSNAQAGGRGTVSILGPMRITAPGQAAIVAHYDGRLETLARKCTENGNEDLHPLRP